ncbi:MAG: aminotransferase class IV [Micromonosporaceae bacterium]
MRIEIDGGTATAEQLAYPALVNYGHFTAMQLRGGRVRGLDLHLTRLRDATRELFDADLEDSLVRDRIRHALGGTTDASVQVRIFSPGDDILSIMVVVREPVDMPPGPWRLRSVPYQRPVAHLKHVGGFGQRYYERLAARDGYDDVLLTAPDGQFAETGIANLGFLAGDTVVWPAAPALPGITYQLLVRALGPRSRHLPVTLADLGRYDSAFVCNSWGVAPVASIDTHPLPPPPTPHPLAELYATLPATPP